MIIKGIPTIHPAMMLEGIEEVNADTVPAAKMTIIMDTGRIRKSLKLLSILFTFLLSVR
jgi:hypothetical protein